MLYSKNIYNRQNDTNSDKTVDQLSVSIKLNYTKKIGLKFLISETRYVMVQHIEWLSYLLSIWSFKFTSGVL